MTVPEKVNLTTGTGWGSGPCVGNTGSVPRLGIPSLCLQDGPNGVRFTDFVTHFPSGLATGSTFNKELMKLKGRAEGREFKDKNVHIALSPTIGPIGLKAQGGRNWESFGADPYLQGVAGAHQITGIQMEGVVAVARHFIGNEQEHFRQVGEWDSNGWEKLQTSISANIGDRTMHEVYLWPFADAVHAGVGGILCLYNQVNNTHACENSYLLNYLLKEELGFQGFVVSDWGAQHTGVELALAGLDMSMPGEIFDEWLSGRSFWGPSLTRAIYNETIPQERLNDMVTRILVPFFSTKALTLPSEEEIPNFSSWTFHTYGQQYPYQHYGPISQQNWHIDARSEFSDKVAQEIAREAIILLKNVGHHLPIEKSNGIRRLLIVGSAQNTDRRGVNCKDQRCTEGVLTSGWGSAAVNNPIVVTPFQAIQERAIERGITVDANTDNWNLAQAEEQADYADMAVVIVSAHSGEGYIEVDDNFGDRKNVSLWNNGDKLIQHVADRCRKTVVVVTSTGPVDMEQWIEHENVVGVLFAAPLGQYVGEAVAEVLFGEVNPSGRLPFTIAKKPLHYVPVLDNLNEGTEPQDIFDRGIYLDYRFFDKHAMKPRFPFGYGLSYTKFQVFNLKIKELNSPTEYLISPEKYIPVSPTVEDDVCDPEDALFPYDEFDTIPGFIYPYLYDEKVRLIEEDESYDYPKGYTPTHRSIPPLAGGGMGGNPALWEEIYEVTVLVSNEGLVAGAYVSQLYVEFPATIAASPPKALRGFEKVYLSPKLSAVVTFTLLHRDLSIWDTQGQQWIIQTGTYKIYVASSSRKVELVGEIEIGS
ncbi:beta-glucosidase [Metschnikowia aff. pulcherrima]|uniref:beta-glucosidase n=1 Tax=Metschnikowia aff. pulcherrima TaxID=2163413 RepID=A0A4P6XJC0_9ASCO|nr:beta-glucosidase [Metschnikowia aff. pulcherrima]